MNKLFFGNIQIILNSSELNIPLEVETNWNWRTVGIAAGCTSKSHTRRE